MKWFKFFGPVLLGLFFITHQALDVNMSERQFDEVLKSGSMDGYLTYKEFRAYLRALRSDETNNRYISSDVVFGRTYEGRKLVGYYFTDNTETIDQYLTHKNVVLINSVHHSREPLTLTMILLMTRELLKLVRSKQHSKIKEFLRDNVIFFIPVVNLDSYLYINKHFHDSNSQGVRMIRKNRHIHPQCNEITGGVDLNRNYDFKFGINETGSSGNPCAEDYRGERPFSEPETASIKKYVDDHPNIISAVNIHTYGNSWIYPFNYVSDKNDHFLQMKKRLFFDFYKEFEHEISDQHIKALFGNAAFALDYPTNGEAGDWFTGKKNILNIDVELGNENPKSEQFYPPKSIIPDIVRYNWIVMKQFLYRHIINLNHRIIISGNKVIFEIKNNSISNLIDFEGLLRIDSPPGSEEPKIYYCLKELPDSPETLIPVINQTISATLKGRHILSVHLIFPRKSAISKLRGLQLLLKRNSSFLNYRDQSYYFKVERKKI